MLSAHDGKAKGFKILALGQLWSTATADVAPIMVGCLIIAAGHAAVVGCCNSQSNAQKLTREAQRPSAVPKNGVATVRNAVVGFLLAMVALSFMSTRCCRQAEVIVGVIMMASDTKSCACKIGVDDSHKNWSDVTSRICTKLYELAKKE